VDKCARAETALTQLTAGPRPDIRSTGDAVDLPDELLQSLFGNFLR